MSDYEELEVDRFLNQLNDPDIGKRLNAINQLSEIGDEHSLKELRNRLKQVSREHQALIVAVGKLKRELGIH
ncbi:MAG: hypothetical protein JXA77_15505 [Bacteroidales bacterium]|nr:hypothetical protein [Bacteroidales bacterium]MBN2817903.1 hypothetical protein [Bacteroidales bacterium]